nr:SRPBCC family protein [Streptomyces sp. NRRL F-5135]
MSRLETMEHEVFVPVVAEALRRALRDPSRVARCVPGIQQAAEEGAGPLVGRLRFRVGGHTITYRGALTLVERDGVFTVEGEGAEVRGSGTVKVVLSLRLTERPDGTALTFTGSSGTEGRLTEFSDETTTAAARRLLGRFAVRLAEEAEPEPATNQPAPPPPADAAADPLPAERSPGGESSREAVGDVSDVDDVDDAGGVDDVDALLNSRAEADGAEFLVPDTPPAEAAHARRTMIGRSAEEVDHAPPRGRYAPVPAPDAATTRVTLRWVAPAAALALASAVVVGRALRRRK